MKKLAASLLAGALLFSILPGAALALTPEPPPPPPPTLESLQQQIASLLQLIQVLQQQLTALRAAQEPTTPPPDDAIVRQTITVLTPNGGESYASGRDDIAVRFTTTGVADKTITVKLYSPVYGLVRAQQNVPATAGSTIFQLAKGGIEPAGQYKIEACVDGLINVCDTTDNYITLTPFVATGEFNEGFEGDVSGWGTQGPWQISTSAHSGQRSFLYGPLLGYSQSNTGELVSPSFTPSSASLLGFYSTATGFLFQDAREVFVQTASGARTRVWVANGADTTAWQKYGDISLANWAGQQVSLVFKFSRLSFWPVQFTVSRSWNVDDIFVNDTVIAGEQGGGTGTTASSTVTLSLSNAVDQSVVPGAGKVTFARYLLDAQGAQENIRITQLPLRYNATTIGIVRDCRLYEGSVPLMLGDNVIDTNTIPSTPRPLLDVPVVVAAGTFKILELKCNVPPTAEGTYRWGLSSDPLSAIGLTSGNPIIPVTVVAAAGPQTTITPVAPPQTVGTLSVILDSSSPISRLLQAGTTGNTLTVLKLRAENEDISLTRLGLKLTGAGSLPQNLTRVTLHDETGTQVGEAVFTGSDYTATSSLVQGNFIIPRNSEKLLIIKGDLAAIGTSQAGSQGAFIAIDYDYQAGNLAHTRGIGQESGTHINSSSFSDTQSSDSRVFKALPVVTLIAPPSSFSGNNASLYRFKIEAVGGPVDIYGVTLSVAATPSDAISNIALRTYADQNFSQLEATGQSVTPTNLSSALGDVALLARSAASAVRIPANSARYFEVRADVSGSYEATVKLKGDNNIYVQMRSADVIAGGLSFSPPPAGLVWSPVTTDSTTPASTDWANGYLVQGLPTSGLSSVTSRGSAGTTSGGGNEPPTVATGTFSEGFEGDVSGWRTQGPWQVSTSAHSGQRSFLYAPTLGPSGISELVSPPFTPSSASRLGFYSKATGFLFQDAREVFVQTASGARTRVWVANGADTTAWQKYGDISLANWAGQPVSLVFKFSPLSFLPLQFTISRSWNVDDIFVNNTVVAGGGAGTMASSTVTLSLSDVVDQVVAPGQGSTIFARYLLDARGAQENIKITQLPLRYNATTTGSVRDCRLYDGSVPLMLGDNVIDTNTIPSTPRPLLDVPVVVGAGTFKTLRLKCGVSSSAEGTYRWGLSSDPLSAIGLTSGNLIPVTVAAAAGPQTTITPGAITPGIPITDEPIVPYIPPPQAFISSSGVQPVVTFIAPPSSFSGNDASLYRFKIEAVGGPVDIYGVTVSMAATPANAISNIALRTYADQNFSQLEATGQSVTPTNLSSTPGNVALLARSAASAVRIPANSARYFEVRADVSGSYEATLRLKGDDELFSGLSQAVSILGRYNFAWSPVTTNSTTPASSDWTNGYLVQGLPPSGLSSVTVRGSIGTTSGGGNEPPTSQEPQPAIITGSWTINGLWRQVRTGGGDPFALTHSGDAGFWYGNPTTGNYMTGSSANSGELTSPAITPAAGTTLSFWSWQQTDFTSDTLEVFVQEVNGGGRTRVQAVTDNAGAWRQYSGIDLTPWAGRQVKVVFRFDTKTFLDNQHRGWYLDDIALTAPVTPVTPATPVSGTTGQQGRSRLAALATPISWVSYYGENKLSDLGQFTLVDLEGENYTAADITSLKSDGSIVLSYLNLGACEGERPYFSSCDTYKRDAYQGFPGEYWMDVSNPGFRNLVLTQIAPVLVALGIDGFYLDNIDVAETYQNEPAMREGIISLVRDLRAAYPNLILVAQNGLLVIDDIASYVDAVAKEDVYSLYNFDTNAYGDRATDETREIVGRLTQLKQRGLPILTLDYHTDPIKADEYRRRAITDGFSPYIGTINLNTLASQSGASASANTEAATRLAALAEALRALLVSIGSR